MTSAAAVIFSRFLRVAASNGYGSFNLPEGAPVFTYAEVEYTNCNNDRTATKKFFQLGIQTLCSITSVMSNPLF